MKILRKIICLVKRHNFILEGEYLVPEEMAIHFAPLHPEFVIRKCRRCERKQLTIQEFRPNHPNCRCTLVARDK